MKNKLIKLTKVILYIFLSLVILGFFLSFYYHAKTKPTSDNALNKLPLQYIRADQQITACKQRNLENKILLIKSKYCTHCKRLLKTLTPLITRYQLENNFQALDIIDKKDLQTLNSLAIGAISVPILIINCQAYVGIKHLDRYQELLANFHEHIKTL